MEIMSDDVTVWDPHTGSQDNSTRLLWRRNRNAAYRAGYAELNGEPHPASLEGQPKEDLDLLLENTEPPYGMGWADFGVLWDLHHEHPYTPVLRKRSVDDEWKKRQDEAGQPE
jgi:hypothetical protein